MANRRFQIEAIRANRSHVMKIGFFTANRFAQIDPRESPQFALRIAGPSKLPSKNPSENPSPEPSPEPSQNPS